MSSETAPTPDLKALFLGFSSVGLSGFGGVLPFARRMLVEERRWMSAEEFNAQLGLCQFLPGPNVVNLAVVVGKRCAGLSGAIVAPLGLLAGPIVIVLLLYVGLAVAITASVGERELTSSGATLLAVAARENFGAMGFHVLLLSAILSTVTCLNGGFFGVTSITYRLAENGQLPARFGQAIGMSSRGLTISAGLALLLVNFLTLTTVASLGSATSLLVYSLVTVSYTHLTLPTSDLV